MNAIVEVETARLTADGYEGHVITLVTGVRELTYAVSTFAMNTVDRLRNVTAPAPNTIFEGNVAVG